MCVCVFIMAIWVAAWMLSLLPSIRSSLCFCIVKRKRALLSIPNFTPTATHSKNRSSKQKAERSRAILSRDYTRFEKLSHIPTIHVVPSQYKDSSRGVSWIETWIIAHGSCMTVVCKLGKKWNQLLFLFGFLCKRCQFLVLLLHRKNKHICRLNRIRIKR